MKYLSFDIECCDGSHICEFGYVLIDEQFNVLKRDCITINPEHKFKLCGSEKVSNITLAFPEEVYYNSPTFDYYYDKIKSILTTPDCQIVGFSLKNDETFLATAYEIYGKEHIDFTYYDFQKLYQGYTECNQRTSVKGFVYDLHIDDITLHKSDDDAWAVLRALQVIGEREKLTLPETLQMLLSRNSNYMAERAKERNLALIEKINSGNLKAQNEFLKRFISKLIVSEDKCDEVFFGKSVCISSHFQKYRFNEFLSIIERLYLYGATYTGKASVCDIFIEYQQGEEEEVRLSCVRKAVETEDKSIQVLTLDEALSLLSLTVEDLNKVDHINDERYKQKPREKVKESGYKDKSTIPTTIGELLTAKGIKIN